MDKNTSAATTLVDPHLGPEDVRPKSINDIEKGHQNANQIPPAVAVVDEVDRKGLPTDSQDGLEFPDGGWRAWSVCLGGACVTISTFGYVNSWGAFQAYYEAVKFPDHSPSTIAWVGSIQYSLIFVPGLVVGRLFDRGYFRLPFMSANFVFLLATFMVAECRTFPQVLVCQGILTGIACGTMFSPLLAVLSHWFKRRRQLAFGLIAVGSSIGGTVIPLVVKALLPSVGFKWTMRILGFILLGTTSIANLLLRPRLPPRKHVRGRLIDVSQFKNLAFSVYSVASLIAFLGLYTMLTYVASYATERQIIKQSSAYNLVAIANASSLIGRLLTGVLADKNGPLNVMTPLTIAAGVLTYAWPQTRTLSSLIPITVLYGISSGAFVALFGSPAVSMGTHDSVGERTGMLFVVTAIGALAGPPISGAIRNSSQNWTDVGVYAGNMILFAVILMTWTRYLVLGKLWGGVI
ncbi:related to monocarboxylate transporter [Serendipita indica DSM 11827]|uniref:Related to monocarboxylate transporter n=1 Tax=Serendipita indica (strain DSM 11827) TaxID=1109443 RepID=G4T6N8_SERID|nr:related to monocarboxylate transporter [Serendipita indica DSM 11827]